MSKKSRKRNKKILGALAAGLGAMALMKRKKAASIAGMDDAGIGVTHPALQGPYITKKADTAVAAPKKVFLGNTRLQRDGVGPNEAAIARRLTAGNRVPPSMRGGALHAQGYTPRNIGSTHPLAKNFKHGGKVTGAAKRGFGRALMKGKK